MSEKKKAESNPSTQEILGCFVLRARRVESHSLVKSRDINCYRIPTITMSASEAGEIRIKRHACANEEAIESLASRLRPFIVRSESIYLPKVFSAIKSQVSTDAFAVREAEAFNAAESWFAHRYKNKDSKCYGVQTISTSGVPETKLLSDALLAESWIYTDTVHADPRGAKAEAQQAGYLERYVAASSYFCEFAAVVVSLLNIVRSLSKQGMLQIPNTAWSEPISYLEAMESASKDVIVDAVYSFPVGTEIPPDVELADIPGARKITSEFFRTKMLESNALVLSFDADKKQTGAYPARCKDWGDSFEFSINEIGTLSIPKGSLTKGTEPKKPIQFVPIGSEASKASEFLRSVTPPNWFGLIYTHDSQPFAITAQLQTIMP